MVKSGINLLLWKNLDKVLQNLLFKLHNYY